MMVTIIIPTALRQHTNNEDELKLNARTVNDALSELVTAFPNLRMHLYSENGRLRSFIKLRPALHADEIFRRRRFL